MRIRTLALATTLLAAGMLAACSGGSTGGGGPTVTPPTTNPGGGGNPDPNGYIASSIAAINSIGAPLQENLTSVQNPGSSSTQSKSHVSALNVNACNNIFQNTSVFFKVPDTNGDTNSTELQRFAGSGCNSTQLMSDTVHVWTTPNGGSESVTVTTSKWQAPSPVGSTPTTVRVSTVNYTNAAGFTKYGDPIFQAGTTRSENGKLSANGTVVTLGGNEWIDGGPVQNQQNQEIYCGDSAGYNATGDSTLGETFGWSSMTSPSNGVRSLNTSTGDVTFTATRTGTALVGPVGFVGIATNNANSACPITTPEYTANATNAYKQLSFSMLISYTFNSGFLKNVTISNGTLTGYTLTAATITGQNGQTEVSGSVATTAGTTIAQFTVNMNGFGTLSMIGGSTYQITDWHIIN